MRSSNLRLMHLTQKQELVQQFWQIMMKKLQQESNFKIWTMIFLHGPISILPDCNFAPYNTARVTTLGLKMKMTPAIKDLKWKLTWMKLHFLILKLCSHQTAYKDEIRNFDPKIMLASDWLQEQLNVTRDWSDYLWYMTEMARQAVMELKLVLLMYYKNGKGHNFRRQVMLSICIDLRKY